MANFALELSTLSKLSFILEGELSTAGERLRVLSYLLAFYREPLVISVPTVFNAGHTSHTMHQEV